MTLSTAQQKHLRSLAHKLSPVVRVGQHGLSENVLKEVELALDHHELIKLKISVGDRDQRHAVIQAIQEHSNALLVQSIGNIAVLYRRNRKKPVIQLPS